METDIKTIEFSYHTEQNEARKAKLHLKFGNPYTQYVITDVDNNEIASGDIFTHVNHNKLAGLPMPTFRAICMRHASGKPLPEKMLNASVRIARGEAFLRKWAGIL